MFDLDEALGKFFGSPTFLIAKDRRIPKATKEQYSLRRPNFHRFVSNPISIIGLGIVAAFFFMGIFANYIAPYPADASYAVHLYQAFQAPSLAHPLGTDNVGRDILTRLLFGIRTTMYAGLLAEAITALIAIPIGLVAGYYAEGIGTVIMRIGDIFMALPPLLLAFVAASVFTPSLTIEALAVSVAWWPWFARIIYSVVISVRHQPFVDASRLAGKSSRSVIFTDIFPHVIPVSTVKITIDVGFAVLFVASLSFLGLGVPEPIPDWGAMIAAGRTFLPAYWWISTFPGIFIFLAVLGFSLLGDGLRDYFDVRIE